MHRAIAALFALLVSLPVHAQPVDVAVFAASSHPAKRAVLAGWGNDLGHLAAQLGGVDLVSSWRADLPTDGLTCVPVSQRAQLLLQPQRDGSLSVMLSKDGRVVEHPLVQNGVTQHVRWLSTRPGHPLLLAVRGRADGPDLVVAVRAAAGAVAGEALPACAGTLSR